MDRIAAELDELAGRLTEAARRLPGWCPDRSAFGADGPGRLGEVGRALHARFAARLDAHAGEADALADVLGDTAQAVRAAAAAYAAADDNADRRLRRET